MPLNPRKSHLTDRQKAHYLCRQASAHLDLALRGLHLAMQLDPKHTQLFLEKEIMGQLTTDWSVIKPNVLDADDVKTAADIHATAQGITPAPVQQAATQQQTAQQQAAPQTQQQAS